MNSSLYFTRQNWSQLLHSTCVCYPSPQEPIECTYAYYAEEFLQLPLGRHLRIFQANEISHDNSPLCCPGWKGVFHPSPHCVDGLMEVMYWRNIIQGPILICGSVYLICPHHTLNVICDLIHYIFRNIDIYKGWYYVILIKRLYIRWRSAQCLDARKASTLLPVFLYVSVGIIGTPLSQPVTELTTFHSFFWISM